MAFFNARELKEKMSGGGRNVRELKHEGTVKLWIPNEEFFYARKHFNLHLAPSVKSGVKSCWCTNTSPQLTEKCDVCDDIQALWKQWRDANEKDKQKIQGIINKLVDEKYWINAIDVSDSEQRFIAVKFTASRIKEILTIIEKHPINTIIWSYKKSVTKNKDNSDRVSYSLTEDADHPKALELSQNYDFLWGRSFEEGGPVDLEKAYGKQQTYEQLHDYLTKHRTEDESESELAEDEAMSLDDVSTSKTTASKPATALKTTTTTASKPATTQKTTTKPKEEDISLDNLSLDGDTELSLDSEQLSLDGDELSLDGDELSLDDLDNAPKVKMVQMPKDFIVKNIKNRPLLSQVIEYFVEQKFIKAENDMNKDVNAVNKYLKANDVEVPESLLEESIPI